MPDAWPNRPHARPSSNAGILRRSQVFVTLPANLWTPSVVTLLIEAGADGVRMIAKGVPPREFREAIGSVLESAARARTTYPFQVIVDLPGGRPRLGGRYWEFALKPNDLVNLVPVGPADNRDPRAGEVPVVGLTDDVLCALTEGDRIVAADGEIVLQAAEVHSSRVVARCIEARRPLQAMRSINLPDTQIVYEAVSTHDLAYLDELGDCSGLHALVSMVVSPDNVTRVRAISNFSSVGAKIESPEGLRRLTETCEAADRVVVARGDLSVECPLYQVPMIGKAILDAAESTGTPVILASGILDSLATDSHPRVAEVTDLWTHHEHGVRQFLLSGSVCVEAPWVAARWARKMLDQFSLDEVRIDSRYRSHPSAVAERTG